MTVDRQNETNTTEYSVRICLGGTWQWVRGYYPAKAKQHLHGCVALRGGSVVVQPRQENVRPARECDPTYQQALGKHPTSQGTNAAAAVPASHTAAQAQPQGRGLLGLSSSSYGAKS